jgi:hypothetical protein
MPELIWRYLTTSLYYRTSASCVALAEALKTVSHDRLTRLLPGDWSGPRLLELAWRSDARHRLRGHPDFVLFGAWHPSRALLKRIRDYG